MSGSSLVDYWFSEGSSGYNHLQNRFFFKWNLVIRLINYERPPILLQEHLL